MNDITGSYKIRIPIQNMFLNTELVIKGHNLITLFGESFFLNRCINNEFGVIEYIALGNASLSPRKDDIVLGNETSRKKCECSIDIKEKQIKLNASFKASEIIGTSEIGVFNNRIMISHDRFQKIDDSFLGLSGEVNIDYTFQFTTGALKGGWNDATIPYVFYSIEPNNVVGVYEKNSNSWYYKVDSLNDLTGMNGAYYYDNTSKNLYIRPKRDMQLSELTDNMEIIVQVK